MSDPGVEAPIGPVLPAPRRSRDRFRILAVTAIAVVVVGAGIGLAGNGPSDTATASRSPGSSLASTAPASLPPSGGQPTRVLPTQNAGLACAPVRPGSPVELRVSSDASTIAPTEGLTAAAGPTASGSTTATWPVPPESLAARLAGAANLLLVPDLDACVRSVLAEYRPADPTLKGPFPIALRSLDVTPPRNPVTLGPMPTGDWVVRVVASFSTGIAEQKDAGVAERFFRVISGSGAGPLPTPETSPAVPCAPLPASATPPGMTIAGTDQGEVPGIPPGTGPPAVLTATIGDPLEIRSAGDACARSWIIDATNIDTGASFNIENQENPTNDPFRFAQNRWRLLSLPTGLLQMTATMRYSADVQVSRRWSLIVSAPDFPPTVFRAPDGTTVVAAQGCEAIWAFPSGSGGAHSCTGPTIMGDLQTLDVPAGSPVRLEAQDGWTITSWSGTCGTISAGGSFDPFAVVDGCDLGASLAPGPVVFLPRPNAPVVRLYVSLQRAGVVASNDVYVTIRTAP